MDIKDIEVRVKKIEERNKKVEADKAWETSITRKILVVIFTYIAIGIFLKFINIPNPWLNAVAPSVGFLLSTLTLPYIKSFWIKYIYKKNK